MSLRAPSPPPEGARLRILIASDSPVLAAGVAAALRSQGMSVAGIIRNLDGVKTAPLDGVNAVVITPANGMATDIVPLLRDRAHGAPAIILLPDIGLRIHSEALKGIHAACLPLTSAPQEIAEAIRTTVDPAIFAAAVTGAVVRGAGGALTARELEALDAAAQGMTNRAIAAELGISVETAKSHMTSVYRKLGVKNRAEAVAAYLEAR